MLREFAAYDTIKRASKAPAAVDFDMKDIEDILRKRVSDSVHPSARMN
jgi:hypothetical protein